jgi:hypothetical protein
MAEMEAGAPSMNTISINFKDQDDRKKWKWSKRVTNDVASNQKNGGPHMRSQQYN